MSSRRWVSCLLAAAMTAASSVASGEPPDPRWRRLVGQAVVVEQQDGGRVAGKLASVEEERVEVLAPDGRRMVVERTQIKALRSKLHDEQVTVTTASDERVRGKLAESDDETIVVETDDGRRVTIARASIRTVRDRQPARSLASAATYTATEDAPPNGSDLLVSGAAAMGVGAGFMAGAPFWLLVNTWEADTRRIVTYVQLTAGGILFVSGAAVLISGAVQRSKFNEWRRQHGDLAFVPTRGGGALTWQGSF